MEHNSDVVSAIRISGGVFGAHVAAAFIGLVAGGAGHGTTLPFLLFFPYSILARLVPYEPAGLVLIVLALLQVVAYAAILAVAESRDRFRRAAFRLALVHATLAVVVVSAAIAYKGWPI